MSKFRNFAITDFKRERDFYKNLNYRYLILGEEICPETKKVHWQGFIIFNNRISLKGLIKKMEGRHVEVCKANALQNIAYCEKDGNVILEDGDRPKQGKRNDIARAKEIITTTGKMKDVVLEVESYQAIRIAEIMLKYVEPKRDWKPEVFWFYGGPGTGKTRQAYEDSNEGNRWVSGKCLKWWEGYDAHEDVILDDFRADTCPFHVLLRILDRYDFRIECKGSSRQLLAKRIWITSCYHPKDVYPPYEDVNQLLRRIDVIKEFGPQVLDQKSRVILGLDFEDYE